MSCHVLTITYFIPLCSTLSACAYNNFLVITCGKYCTVHVPVKRHQILFTFTVVLSRNQLTFPSNLIKPKYCPHYNLSTPHFAGSCPLRRSMLPVHYLARYYLSSELLSSLLPVHSAAYCRLSTNQLIVSCPSPRSLLPVH
jgi:hypothetical protein